MLGICMGFTDAVCDGVLATEGVFVGTTIGVPLLEGSLGEDRSTTVVGVVRPDPGEAGGADDSARDILNCETLDGFGCGALEGPHRGISDVAGATSFERTV